MHQERTRQTCACGCGQEIPSTGVRGKPQRYARGHNALSRAKRGRLVAATQALAEFFDAAGVPYGKCCCGCGAWTTLAVHTQLRNGHVEGEPHMYLNGHGCRITRFEWVAEDRGYATPCHIWQHAKTSDGYGHYARDGEHHYAHRDACERAHGPIPEGYEVDHLCSQHDCVNGGHLEAVTHGENGRRAYERGERS